ncbi:nuclear transport factor 2 family protein [Mangrovimonas spongiae]|uniref:Nuclear transport factor 2 family protein n=1 Tax=Mangrovimonas spongiae TaxID=2494697 RepID=A0A428JWW2_9FLAO|nr:nuclear transport factor 2 family protein [Mangrovimonas spongiae]RSK38546.1 nuclear transport factor 2 family protein [Mangrovimonas spongiae]
MENTINAFYKAFNNLDAETMVSYYHDDIVFKDPAFGTLKGHHAKNMWRMLCQSQKNKDFKVTAYNITNSSATWEAFYTFSKTKRKIHNTVNAKFMFQDGKIISHTDTFNLYKWSKQALGLKGTLIGWTPFFKTQFQQQTNKLLHQFEQKHRSN